MSGQRQRGRKPFPRAGGEATLATLGGGGGGAQGTAPPTVRGPPPSAQITKLEGVRL